jgi:hypothetical protein
MEIDEATGETLTNSMLHSMKPAGAKTISCDTRQKI